jgi:hypothetical protein
MNRPEGLLKRGTEILTHATLGDTEGMLVDPLAILRRRADARGKIDGAVAGHLGEVYWVEHGDPSTGRGCRAPYHVGELERIEVPMFNTNPDQLASGGTSRQAGEAPSVRTFAGALRARIEGFFAARATDVQGEAAR